MGSGLVERQRAARDPLRQVLTLDQLHHERPRVARTLEAVDLGDVGMIERRQRLGLALETRQPLGVAGNRRRQRLQRDVAAQRRVARPIDLAHPAGAEQGQHLVRSDAGADLNRHAGMADDTRSGRNTAARDPFDGFSGPSGQRVEHSPEAEAGEVLQVHGGELPHPLGHQAQGQSGVEMRQSRRGRLVRHESGKRIVVSKAITPGSVFSAPAPASRLRRSPSDARAGP